MDVSTTVRTAMRNGAMLGLATQIAAAGAGSRLAFFSTAKPTAGGSPGGPPMVAVILGFPVGTVSAGILTLSDTAFAQITAGGSAVWARLFDAADTWTGSYTHLTLPTSHLV